MMLFKRTLFVCLFLILVFLFSSNALAESSKLPVLLKMNQFFVLYTNPEGPYIDKGNRLMVPARIFCQKLIGADVKYFPETKRVNINFDGNSLEMTLYSDQYSVNGKFATMDTAPVVKKGTVFVPIRAIINAFNINTSWNKEYRYISLDDERIMKTQMVEDMLDLVGGAGDNANAFIPVRFQLDTTLTDTCYRWEYEAALKNITGEDIPEGKEGVQIFWAAGNGISYSDRYGEKPAVKKDSLITKKGIVECITEKEELDFILILGRTI